MRPLLFAISLLVIPSPSLLGTTVVYETDFSTFSGNGYLAGAGILTSASGNALMWNSASGRPAAATELHLAGLLPHDQLDLSFTFWTIDSWDGLSNTCCGTDYLEVLLDGHIVYRAAFRVWGILPPRVESESVPGTAQLVFANGSNLFGNPDYTDAVWQLTLPNLPHGSATAVFQFRANGTGWDGGLDESFALDNITVALEPLPEPRTQLLTAAALVAVGWAGRRRFSTRR